MSDNVNALVQSSTPHEELAATWENHVEQGSSAGTGLSEASKSNDSKQSDTQLKSEEDEDLRVLGDEADNPEETLLFL